MQVRTPRAQENLLADLENRADLVLIDAPCTGIGTWRRNPDAKWRVRPGALELRLEEQAELLDRAAALVKLGGRIAYVTCSLLADENGDQVRAFLARRGDFALVPPAEIANTLGERAYLFRHAALMSEEGLLMTPRRTDTDGFYVAVLIRHGRAAYGVACIGNGKCKHAVCAGGFDPARAIARLAGAGREDAPTPCAALPPPSAADRPA